MVTIITHTHVSEGYLIVYITESTEVVVLCLFVKYVLLCFSLVPLIVLLFVSAQAVDRSNFKTCDQSAFCK